jgi:predicted  nucleic acid-binding Zn-ribbon protein
MTVETETEPTVDIQVDDPQAEEIDPIEGAESLGDAGKKALDAMKAQRKAALDRAKAAEAERDALMAQVAGKEAEYAAEQEKQRIKDEALSAANKRILSAEWTPMLSPPRSMT